MPANRQVVAHRDAAASSLLEADHVGQRARLDAGGPDDGGRHGIVRPPASVTSGRRRPQWRFRGAPHAALAEGASARGRQLRMKCAEEPIGGLDQHHARGAPVDGGEVTRQHMLEQLAERAGRSTPVGPPPAMTMVSAPSRRPDRVRPPPARTASHVAAKSEGFGHAFEAEGMLGDAGHPDSRRSRPPRRGRGSRRGAGRSRRQHLPPAASMPVTVAMRTSVCGPFRTMPRMLWAMSAASSPAVATCTERLERVVFGSVDDHHPGTLSRQRLLGGEAAETGTPTITTVEADRRVARSISPHLRASRPLPCEQVFVKICGITWRGGRSYSRLAMGADALGFVFEPSTSQVSPSTVVRTSHGVCRRRCSRSAYSATSTRRVVEIVRRAGLRLLRLHWPRAPGSTRDVRSQVSVRDQAFVAGSRELDQADQHGADAHHARLAERVRARSFDWPNGRRRSQRCQGLNRRVGLTPETSPMPQRLRPWGVDVSTGVEREAGRRTP